MIDSRTRQDRKCQKRYLLQQAALVVFSKQGYHQSRIEDIIGHAKVGKGTFYLYFKNKEDLVFSLLEDFIAAFDQIHQWVSSSILDTSDISTIFKEEGKVIIELLHTNRELALFLLKEGRSVSESINKKINDFYNDQSKQAEKTYTQAKKMGLIKNIDPKYAAWCVVGGIAHIYTLWLEGKISDPIDKILEKTLNFYLSALIQ